MEEFKSNSDFEKRNNVIKKHEPVVTSQNAKVKKKSEIRKLADDFLVEDFNNVKSFIYNDVIMPAVKNIIRDIINSATNMLLYGDSNHESNNNNRNRTPYNSLSSPNSNKMRPSARRAGIDYDDIIFNTRLDADKVLDKMFNIIREYGVVSVADLYDLANVSFTNFNFNRYGWDNINGAHVAVVRDGYIIKLPSPISLN